MSEATASSSSSSSLADRKKVYFVKLSENAKTPKQSSKYSAGHDLFSSREIIVPAYSRALVATDLIVKLPRGMYGRIAPRSGLALRNGVETGDLVIDEDHHGPIQVLFFNHSSRDLHINIGDRICQLICQPISYVRFCQLGGESGGSGDGGDEEIISYV